MKTLLFLLLVQFSVAREYAIIDLGSTQNVVGMATQGRPDPQSNVQRVTRYRLEYSLDGNTYFSINNDEYHFVFDGECGCTLPGCVDSKHVDIRMYEGSSDNPGDDEGTRTKACYEACITHKSILNSHSWDDCQDGLGGFAVTSDGRCYCECFTDSAVCDRASNTYNRYDISPNGVFEANHDQNTVVSNYFQPVRARYIKLSIVAYNYYASIRMAPILSSMKQKVLNPPDNMRHVFGAVHADCATSSMLDGEALCFDEAYGLTKHLTIDLGEEQTLVGVVTQGRKTHAQWIKSYKLQYSRTGETAYEYIGQGYCADYAGTYSHMYKSPAMGIEDCYTVCNTPANIAAYSEYFIYNPSNQQCYCGHSGPYEGCSNWVPHPDTGYYSFKITGVNSFKPIGEPYRNFKGNSDQNTKVTNYFEPVRARYVRLTISDFNAYRSIRMGAVVMEHETTMEECLEMCDGEIVSFDGECKCGSKGMVMLTKEECMAIGGIEIRDASLPKGCSYVGWDNRIRYNTAEGQSTNIPYGHALEPIGTTGTVPPPRYTHGAVEYNGMMYMTGDVDKTVWGLNLTTYEWSIVAPEYSYVKVYDGECSGGHTSISAGAPHTPETCFQACKSSVGFLLGTATGNCWCSSQSIDTCTLNPFPGGEYHRYDITHHSPDIVWSTTKYQNKMIIYNNLGIHSFNMDTRVWTTETTTNTPSFSSGATLFVNGDNLYLFGGSPLKDETWKLDLTTMAWSQMTGTKPNGVRDLDSASDDEAAYVFGGYSGVGTYGNSNQLWKFEFATETWSEIITRGPDKYIRVPDTIGSQYIVLVSSGPPDGSMSEADCEAYANDHPTYSWGGSSTYGAQTGCYVTSSENVFYNTATTTTECRETVKCIEKRAPEIHVMTLGHDETDAFVDQCEKVCDELPNCVAFAVVDGNDYWGAQFYDTNAFDGPVIESSLTSTANWVTYISDDAYDHANHPSSHIEGQRRHSNVVYNGALWVFAGSGDSLKSEVKKLNLTTKVWSRVEVDYEYPRYGASGVLYNGTMVIFGGSPQWPTVMNDVLKLNLEEKEQGAFRICKEGQVKHQHQRCTMEASTQAFETKVEIQGRSKHTEVEYKDSTVYFGGVLEYQKQQKGRCADEQHGYLEGFITREYTKIPGLKVDDLARVKFTRGELSGGAIDAGIGEAEIVEIDSSGPFKFRKGFCKNQPQSRQYVTTNLMECYNICKDDYDVFMHVTTYCYCGKTKRYNCSDWQNSESYHSYYIEEEEGTKNLVFHSHKSTNAKFVLARAKLINNEVYIKAVGAFYIPSDYDTWRAANWPEFIKDLKIGDLRTTDAEHGYALSKIHAEVSTSTLDLDTSYTGGSTAYADLKSCILMCQKDDSCHYISHAEERCMLHTTCTHIFDDKYTVYSVTKSQNVLTQHVYKDHGNPIKSATDCYAYAESMGFSVPETHTINLEGDFPEYPRTPKYTLLATGYTCASSPITSVEPTLEECMYQGRVDGAIYIQYRASGNCMRTTSCEESGWVANAAYNIYETTARILNPPELSRTYSGIHQGQAPGSGSWSRSMLDAVGSFYPSTSGDNGNYPWMKIDLGGMFRVVGVVTQGDSGSSKWTTKITIEYATLANLGFTQITETSDGEFTANTDSNTKKVNFHQPVMARHIKITMKSYHFNMPLIRAGVMVDAELCKDKHGNYVWSHDKCSDLHVEGANGCIYDVEEGTIRWNSNQYTGTSSVVCNATHQCIEQPNAGYMDVDPDFYLDHKGEASLSIEDCKLYANRMKKVFVEGEFDYPTGCSVHKRVYYNTKAGNNCTSMFPCVKRHGHYLTAYNKTSKEWYKIPTNAPPVQRYAHSAMVSGDAMYIYGGKSYIDMGDLWKFNFTMSEWTRLYEGEPVAQAHMAAYKTGLLIHGGYESYGFVKSREDWNMPIKDTKYFDFETGMHAIERRPIVRVEYVRQAGDMYCANVDVGTALFETDNIGTLHEQLTRCSRRCKGMDGKGFKFNYGGVQGRCYCMSEGTKTCTFTPNSQWDQYDIVDPFGQYEYHKSVNMDYSDYAGGNNGAERAFYNKESSHVIGEYECEQLCEASSDCHAYQYDSANCYLRKNVQLRNVESGSYTAMVKDKRFALGHSDLSVTLEECFNYADIYKMESKELYDDKQYKGCFHGDDNIMYYNYMGTECKERCLYRNELDNAPIVVEGDTMVIGKRMSAEVFRPYARSCVEWDEFETNDKLRPRGCFQKDNQVNYNNFPAATWKMVDYGDTSDTYYLHSDFVSVAGSSVEECLAACDSYPFASYATIAGCRCANTDSGAGGFAPYASGVYTKNEITCSQEYKCVDENDRKSYDQTITIEGLFFNRKVKNPEAICIEDGSEEAELKSQAPVLESLRKYNDLCNFLLFSGTCAKVATWEECERYGASSIESLADKPNGCYIMGGTYHFNEIGGQCTENAPCYCRTDKYKDILTGRCKEISEEPIIKSIVYQDRGTDKEIQTELECQVNSDRKITCAQCECFNDYTYGTWGGGMCETCAIGYGKTQCSTPCVDFDGLNRDTMCGGFGKCLFGSSISGVERIFQNTQCMCGQEDQYQLREPEHSPDAYFKSGQTNYFYYDSITDGKTYGFEEAKLECSKYNDLRMIPLNKYCFGVFISDPSNFQYELQMGKTGNEFVMYFRYIEKGLIGSRSKNFGIEQLEFTNLIPEVAEDALCYDDITMTLEGRDICNHFSSETESCSECADGFTGKNCRYKCQPCLLGGFCQEEPGDNNYASCVCPTTNLWEHQCCPAGFKVVELLDWSSLPSSKVEKIKVKSSYDAYTNNERDASYFCKKCPGVHANDWMSDVSEFKVCSGLNRGECIVSNNALSCACKLNEESGMTWKGRACSCDDGIITPYSSDAENAEVTDYGCLIPTGGGGRCPEPNPTSVVTVRFYPKQLWTTQAHVAQALKAGNYVGGDHYIGSQSLLLSSTEWEGGIAGEIQVTITPFGTCGHKTPCHTGEGPCLTDTDCAGTLECVYSSSSIQNYNPTKVPVDFKFCYDPNDQMIGCDPIIQAIELSDSDGSVFDAAYNYKFWNGQTFEEAPENHYVPMTKDGNGDLIIHKQAFPCPRGRYGTVIDGIRDCALCPPGAYQDQTGQSKILSDVDSNQEVDECKLCSENCPDGGDGCFSTSYGAGGNDECISCDPGQEPHSSGTYCVDCNPGYYETGGRCDKCPAGQYQNLVKQTSCIDCDPGESTNWVQASTTCTDCEAGRYAPGAGTPNCNACPIGQSQISKRQTGCITCTTNQYQNEVGQASCKGLATGWIANDLRTTTTLCNLGYQADDKLCTPCGPGKYAEVPVNECKTCLEGEYAPLAINFQKELVQPCFTTDIENGLRIGQTLESDRCVQCGTGGSGGAPDTKTPGMEHLYGEYRPSQKCYRQLEQSDCGASYTSGDDPNPLYVPQGEGHTGSCAYGSCDWRTQNWKVAYGNDMGLKRGVNARTIRNELSGSPYGSHVTGTYYDEDWCNEKCTTTAGCFFFAVLVENGQNSGRTEEGICHLYGSQVTGLRTKRCWSAAWKGQYMECAAGSESWAGTFGSASACADHCGRTSEHGGKNYNPDTWWFGLIWRNPWYGAGYCYCENLAGSSSSYYGSYRCWSRTSNSYSMYGMVEEVRYNAGCKEYYPYRKPCYEASAV